MIRILVTILVIGLFPNKLSAQDSKQGTKIQFSVTRFHPLDRPAPEFIVKNGAAETEVKVPLTYIAGPFSATLRDDQHLDFFEPGATVPVLSTVVPPELQKDLVVVLGVEIINTWHNRLVGDLQTGATPSTFTTTNKFNAETALQPAGLLGSVRLVRRD